MRASAWGREAFLERKDCTAGLADWYSCREVTIKQRFKLRALKDIIEEFQAVDDETRLEFLLEFAALLPPLPRIYHPLRDAGLNMVEECQSPVFLMINVHDGLVRIHADVPAEAPAARSFTSILLQAFDGKPATAVLEAPADILQSLRLVGLVGMQRTRGLTAIYERLRREVIRRMGS